MTWAAVFFRNKKRFLGVFCCSLPLGGWGVARSLFFCCSAFGGSLPVFPSPCRAPLCAVPPLRAWLPGQRCLSFAFVLRVWMRAFRFLSACLFVCLCGFTLAFCLALCYLACVVGWSARWRAFPGLPGWWWLWLFLSARSLFRSAVWLLSVFLSRCLSRLWPLLGLLDVLLLARLSPLCGLLSACARFRLRPAPACAPSSAPLSGPPRGGLPWFSRPPAPRPLRLAGLPSLLCRRPALPLCVVPASCSRWLLPPACRWGFSGAGVGFSGSRSAAPSVCAAVAAVVRALPSSAFVWAGCASGVDQAASASAPSVSRLRVFRAAGSAPAALVARSVSFVRALAAAPGACLLSWPCAPCPAGVRPSASASACFCGSGSGSWASAALAVGLGVSVVVFGVCPPACWRPRAVVVFGAPGWLCRPVRVPVCLSLF